MICGASSNLQHNYFIINYFATWNRLKKTTQVSFEIWITINCSINDILFLDVLYAHSSYGIFGAFLFHLLPQFLNVLLFALQILLPLFIQISWIHIQPIFHRFLTTISKIFVLYFCDFRLARVKFQCTRSWIAVVVLIEILNKNAQTFKLIKFNHSLSIRCLCNSQLLMLNRLNPHRNKQTKDCKTNHQTIKVIVRCHFRTPFQQKNHQPKIIRHFNRLEISWKIII